MKHGHKAAMSKLHKRMHETEVNLLEYLQRLPSKGATKQISYSQRAGR
jgi:hypothetical protein